MASYVIEKKDAAIGALLPYIPHWLHPNYLSIIRLLALIPLVLLMRAEVWSWAIVVFVAAMLLDTLDGTLARQRDQITQLGKFLDPIADKAVFLVLFIGVGWTFLDPITFWMVIISEIVMVVQFFVFVAFLPMMRYMGFVKKMGANAWGKYKGVFQVVGMVFLLISIALPEIRPAAVVCFLLSVVANYVSAIMHHWPTTDPHLFKTRY